MANRTLTQNDRTLVASMANVSFGTILRGWRGSKGLDYIVVGIDRRNKTISCIKHNCINQNGTVHASTRRVRTFSYVETASGRFGIIRGVTSVMGQKEQMNVEAVNAFVRVNSQGHNLEGFRDISLHTQPNIDRRLSSIYK